MASCDAKRVKFLEDIPVNHPAKINVTFLDVEPLTDVDEVIEEEESTPLDLFDDLGGIISEKNNGSINHDKYIYCKENL